MDSLEKIIQKKQRVLETSDDRLIAKVLKIEGVLLAELFKYLKIFSTRGGKLVQDEISDFALNRAIRDKIGSILRQSNLVDSVAGYLTNFDLVDELNFDIHKSLNDYDITKLDIGQKKRLAIEEVRLALTDDKALSAVIERPIRKILYDHVTLGSTFDDAKMSLSVALKKQGILSKYAGQITRDALNGYDGYVNKKLADEIDLNAFRIVGSLKKNSRLNCDQQVNGTGPFAAYHKGRGRYLIADIPKLISISQGRPGWDPSTTPATYIQKRNGFNCRHAFIVMNYSE